MSGLTDDPDFLATTFVVIDFETTTPAGHPAQPIEVAALALRYREGEWTVVGRSRSLIRPPDFAPVTPAVTAQTGLTPEQLEHAPTAAEAFAELDRRFTPDNRYLLVAQHAATEANLIYNQRLHCPSLSRIDFIDTIPLAKHALPDLPNYKLDTLVTHFRIPMLADRHRAQADVQLTAQVFTRLLAAPGGAGLNTLTDVKKIAKRSARNNMPVQSGLFDL